METIWKCFIVLYISILFNVETLRVVAATDAGSFNSPLNSKIPFTSKEFRRLKGTGLEMRPLGNDEISSNAIGEPTCEELRAMWRYDKRQHRAAELNNQIPNLPNLFWDIPSEQPSSFSMFRSRSGNSFRPKGYRKHQDKIFGRVLLSPGSSTAGQRKKPLEQIAEILGKQKPSKIKDNKSGSSEPVVHLISPPEPTPETSFQKLKNLYREERMKDTATNINHNNARNPTPPDAFLGGKEFGRLVLTPPKGQDGRAANKPKELMSPFERLRFGQVDDLLGIKDEIEGKHVLFNFPMKRRNGFISFPKLNQNLRQFGPQLHSSRGTDMKKSSSGRRNQNNDEEPKNDAPSSSTSMQMSYPVTKTDHFRQLQPTTHANQTNVEDEYSPSSAEGSSLNGVELDVQNIPHDSLLERQPLMEVEIPSCPEVEQQSCFINADCTCVGFGLYRCFHGQCQVLSVTSEVSDDYEINANVVGDVGDNAGKSGGGMWHSGSIPNSHLGLWDSSPYIESILTMDEMKKKRKRSISDSFKTNN